MNLRNLGKVSATHVQFVLYKENSNSSSWVVQEVKAEATNPSPVSWTLTFRPHVQCAVSVTSNDVASLTEREARHILGFGIMLKNTDKKSLMILRHLL